MIETKRLLLRVWRESDAAGHRALVTHPDVVRTLGGPPAPATSAEVVARQNAWLESFGSCFWAVEHDGAFIGWCGLKPGPAATPVTDQPEIGWSLHPDHWGRGLAREAAEAVLAWTWANTAHARVWAITTPGNTRSWGLMERLGMTRVPHGGFDHPLLAAGDPLRRHITYVIERPL